MKRKFGEEGYFREPMKELVNNFISSWAAKKLDNPLYLLLSYALLLLIGIFVWSLLFGFMSTLGFFGNLIVKPFVWVIGLL
ncbi:hypothetical protein OAS92_04125 [Candidatus Pelagibacter sp.]|jgi:hypothetical protein|nr:hypothetical protein [Candidatus Pelagibacter sp.]